MHLNINNEFSRLKSVILGHADNCGGQPHLDETYDPKTKEYLKKGIYPYEEDMIAEMTAFAKVLKKHNVEVIRPKNMPDLNQIFTRDICFVIDNKLVIPEILREREDEIDGIKKFISNVPENQILDSPIGVRIEGGDVILNPVFAQFKQQEQMMEQMQDGGGYEEEEPNFDMPEQEQEQAQEQTKKSMQSNPFVYDLNQMTEQLEKGEL